MDLLPKTKEYLVKNNVLSLREFNNGSASEIKKAISKM